MDGDGELIFLLMVFWVCWLSAPHVKRWWRWFRTPKPPPPRDYEAERRRRHQAMLTALHIALRQLSRSPDFQRATQIASKCRDLPHEVRQRVFAQYRPALIRHVAACARRRVSLEQLTKQLRNLAKALGMGAFEGDYIVTAGLGDQRKMAHLLQMALDQLSRSPDFQRVASYAAACEVLPAAVRQKLFSQYKPEMVRHYVRCLARKVPHRHLHPQLRQLVTSLATAPFEADYIAKTAAQRIPTPVPQARPSFEQRMAMLRQEHGRRVATIRSQIEDEDLREQMIEEADNDFRQQLLDLSRVGGQRNTGNGRGVT